MGKKEEDVEGILKKVDEDISRRMFGRGMKLLWSGVCFCVKLLFTREFLSVINVGVAKGKLIPVCIGVV